MDEKQKILDLYNQMQKAMIEKDIETLNKIVLDGTEFVHMSGKTQTKQEFFGEIADGTLNYYKTELKNVKITIDKNKLNNFSLEKYPFAKEIIVLNA